MDLELNQFRSLVGLPARLTADQAAAVLGFPRHDITVLMAKGLLRPLGRPVQNSTKYFATAELIELRSDVKWLGRATDTVQARWRNKNDKKGGPYADDDTGKRSAPKTSANA